MKNESHKTYKAYFNVALEGPTPRMAREFVWTERTFGGYRIVNIPLHVRNVSFGDVMKVDEATGEILSCVRRSIYRNGLLQYSDATDAADPVMKARFEAIEQKLEALGILAEACTPGVASVAVPDHISNKRFKKIVSTIPEITSAYLVPEGTSPSDG